MKRVSEECNIAAYCIKCGRSGLLLGHANQHFCENNRIENALSGGDSTGKDISKNMKVIQSGHQNHFIRLYIGSVMETAM